MPLLLRRDRPVRVAPPVVGLDLLLQRAVVVAVAVDHDRRRQAERDLRLRELGPADGEAGDREDRVRQAQDLAGLIDLVADLADRAGAEPDGFRRGDEALHGERRVDHAVHEGVEIVVPVLVAANLGQPPDAAQVGAEHHEDGRLGRPVHAAAEPDQRLPHRRVLHDDDGILLQVRLGRRRLGAGEQHGQELVGDRPVGVVPLRAAREDLRHRPLGRRIPDAVDVDAKPLGNKLFEGGHPAVSRVAAHPPC